MYSIQLTEPEDRRLYRRDKATAIHHLQSHLQNQVHNRTNPQHSISHTTNNTNFIFNRTKRIPLETHPSESWLEINRRNKTTINNRVTENIKREQRAFDSNSQVHIKPGCKLSNLRLNSQAQSHSV